MHSLTFYENDKYYSGGQIFRLYFSSRKLIIETRDNKKIQFYDWLKERKTFTQILR